MKETINTVKYPEASQWPDLMTRAAASTEQLEQAVAAIIADVKTRGDEALRDYASRFDGVTLADLRVSDAEMDEAELAVDAELKQAIALAAI